MYEEIDNDIETAFNSSQNLSNKEQRTLRKMMTNKNKAVCIDNTDKNQAFGVLETIRRCKK